MINPLSNAISLRVIATVFGNVTEAAEILSAKIVFWCCLVLFVASAALVLFGVGAWGKRFARSQKMVRPLVLLSGLSLMVVATYWGILAFAAGMVPLVPPPGTWCDVMTKDGVLSVDMPGNPVDQCSDSNEGESQVHSDEWVFRGRDGSEFILSCAQSDRFREDPRMLLDKALQMLFGAAQRYGPPALVREKPVDEGAFPGMEWEIAAGNRVIQVRIYVINGRLYQAMAVTGADEEQRWDATRFLDSIRIKMSP